MGYLLPKHGAKGSVSVAQLKEALCLVFLILFLSYSSISLFPDSYYLL